MNRFIISSLIVSFGIVQPLKASEILPSMKASLNPGQFVEQALYSSGFFDLGKARRFLLQLQHEVKEQYGVKLDLNLITDEALSIMTTSGQFSESEIATAEEFYSQLLEPETRVCNSYGHKKKHMKKDSQEFVLPDKMAVGFVFILSGALLCVLPFGVTQGLGTGLIATGIYSVVDGAREGEKPYYADFETGQPVNQNPGSSVGVGVGF